jgi:hypothetical protein
MVLKSPQHGSSLLLAVGKLQPFLEECERDTARLIGAGAAGRLAKWRRHATSDAELIVFVRRLLRGKGVANGWELDQKKGLSLERIVLDHCPELFGADDKEVAAKTLGRTSPTSK